MARWQGVRRAADGVRSSSVRVWTLAPTILQLALAVTIAYLLARYGLDHEAPALACTVALSSLSLSRDARPRRVAETAFAMVMGITLSATIVHFFGRGAIQIGVTLILVTVAATFLSKSPGFALSAGIQSMLVAVLPDPDGGPFLRAVDGVVGGLVALALTAILPYGPLRRAKRSGQAVLRELAACSALIGSALERGRAEDARAATDRLERNRPAVDAWRVSITAAQSVAKFSPISRTARHGWDLRASLLADVEVLNANLMIVSRRATVLAERGGEQPRSAVVLEALTNAFDGIRFDFDSASRSSTPGLVHRLVDTLEEAATHSSVDAGLVAMLRTVTIDLLVATGKSHADARHTLSPILIVPTTGIELPGDPDDLADPRR